MTENQNKPAGNPASDPSNPSQKRDQAEKTRAIKEKNMDETLADSFPSSDPPSSIPDPGEEEDAA
jgi:hypothetical protein